MAMAGHGSGCDPKGICRLNVLCQRCSQCVGHCSCKADALVELELAAFTAASVGVGPAQVEITAREGYERWNNQWQESDDGEGCSS